MRAPPCSLRTREQFARHSRDRKETSKTRARCESRGRRPSSAELHHRSAVAPTWCTFLVFAARLRGLPAREHSLERVPVDSKDPGCRSEEHTSELQSLAYLVCRLLLEKKKKPCSPSQEGSTIQKNRRILTRTNSFTHPRRVPCFAWTTPSRRCYPPHSPHPAAHTATPSYADS